jgi:glycosyltransferase involved in cell wall biosynthesis
MSRQIRTLWLYHHPMGFGGSFNSVLDVLDRRDPGAFEVIAALPAPGSSTEQFERRGVRVVFHREHAGERSLRYLKAVYQFACLLRRERIDLLYVPDYVVWRSAELLAAALTRTPYVLHLRAPLPPEDPIDKMVLAAPAVVGNSRATIQALVGCMPQNRLHVIYNFIDFDRFAHTRDIRQSFFPESPPVVGFVGMFRPEKGIEDFLDAAVIIARQRPDVRFLAVGGESVTMDRGWFSRMQRYARQLGIDRVVHFTGRRTDVPDLMRSMDVLVVPSRNEGFGRVIIEANAVGTPVIGANAAGIPEVIEDGVTGILVPPCDPQAIATAALQILRDLPWRQRVAVEAPARVRERFSPVRQIRALESIWKHAAGV